MQSLTLTFCFVLTATFTLFAQGNIPQPTHEVRQRALDALSPLEPRFEIFYYYNGNGDLYEDKVNYWDGTSWGLLSRDYYTLNANGNPTQILVLRWDADSSKLINDYRYSIGYNANGLEDFYKGDIWSIDEGIWKIDLLWTTIYNINDKIQEETFQAFDDGVVVEGYRTIYQYDALDRLSQDIYQNWDQGIWKNASKEDFSYDGTDEYNYQALVRYWDDTNATWGAVTGHIAQTGTASETIKVYEIGDNGNWIPYSRTTKIYNNDNQLSTLINDSWDDAASYWKINYKYEYFYNADKSNHQYRYSRRDNASDIFFLRDLRDYDYGNYPVSTHSPIAAARVNISPNPTADFVNVEFESNEPAVLTLLDAHGKVVVRTNTDSRIAQLSIKDQPAGTYRLRLEQAGAIRILPVVKR